MRHGKTKAQYKAGHSFRSLSDAGMAYKLHSCSMVKHKIVWAVDLMHDTPAGAVREGRIHLTEPRIAELEEVSKMAEA